MITLEVRRDDFATTRFVEAPLPDLSPGEVLLSLDRFALTANNIIYARCIRLGARTRSCCCLPALPARAGHGRGPDLGRQRPLRRGARLLRPGGPLRRGRVDLPRREGGVRGPLGRCRHTLFFAPSQMVKRSKDWGPAVFQQRLGEAWQRYAAWTDSWLEVVRGHGRDALAAAYDEVLNGRARPHQGHVLSLR